MIVLFHGLSPDLRLFNYCREILNGCNLLVNGLDARNLLTCSGPSVDYGEFGV